MKDETCKRCNHPVKQHDEKGGAGHCCANRKDGKLCRCIGPVTGNPKPYGRRG